MSQTSTPSSSSSTQKLTTPTKGAAILEGAVLHLQYAEVHALLTFILSLFVPLLTWLLVPPLYRTLFPHTATLCGWFVCGIVATKWLSRGCRGASDAALFPASLPLRSRTVIVTGAATGIGRQNVTDFVRLGAAVVVVAARGDVARVAAVIADAKKVAASIGTSPTIVHLPLDLASFASIRQFVAQFRASFTQLDVLVNNAGIMMCDYAQTRDGLELQCGTNHFGHFLLTHLLEDMIRASKGRVICLSSNGHHFAGTGLFYEYYSKPANYDKVLNYGQSKMMNVLHARELNKRLAPYGASAYAVHPGAVATELSRHVDKNKNNQKPIGKWFTWQFLKTPEQGAKTTVFCSHSSSAVPGAFHSDCHVSNTSVYGKSDENAAKLWQLSESLCGINSDASSSTSTSKSK